jgi:hypothetical protein
MDQAEAEGARLMPQQAHEAHPHARSGRVRTDDVRRKRTDVRARYS